MRVTGGALLADALAAADVREVFTLHGGHLDAFLAACGERMIRLTDTRHEASAGHAADAYARVTGELGVCVVTSGPGFTNAYSAIANAYSDRSPVLFVVGAPPLRESETNPLQGGFDQIACASPVTKWSYRVTDPHRIPEIVAMAIRTATTGAPGPVLLEIPIDVMFDVAEESEVRRPSNLSMTSRSAPSERDLRAALELLAEARRPAMVIGGGVTFSRASDAVVAFAQTLGLPVFHLNKSDGAIPARHSLAAGGAGALSSLVAAGLQSPDVVLLVGARQGMFTGGRASAFPGARIIQVDLDASEIGRLYDVEVPIIADCRETLTALTSKAARRTWPDWSEWTSAAVSVQHIHTMVFTDERTSSGRIHPYFAARAVVDACPPDTTFVLDGGEAAAWAEFFVRTNKIGSVLRLGYLGCLGVGPGFAIGAARARPNSPVVVITGDGAAGFHIQEFDTMSRHSLRVVTVVFNNRIWGMSLHGQDAVFGAEGIAVTELADSDYEKAAEAFGGAGCRITDVTSIAHAMTAAITSDVPNCLNIEIDPHVVHPVTTMMLGDLEATDEIVVPYYENIRR